MNEAPFQTVVAIDGPAASGKSSVARELAWRLGLAYVNSGSFYRAITWWLIQSRVDVGDEEAVRVALASAHCDTQFDDGAAVFLVDGAAFTDHLRDEVVNRAVSPVSRVMAVRESVLLVLHSIARERASVIEGRDIGTYVFPDSPYKFYIDASPEVRRQRRIAQGQSDEITLRDRMDSSRTHAPLAIDEDAHVIDSTHLTIDGVVGEVIGRLKLMGLPVAER